MGENTLIQYVCKTNFKFERLVSILTYLIFASVFVEENVHGITTRCLNNGILVEISIFYQSLVSLYNIHFICDVNIYGNKDICLQIYTNIYLNLYRVIGRSLTTCNLYVISIINNFYSN